MNEMSIETFCPYCDEPVKASITDSRETTSVRGEDVTHACKIAQCPLCGKTIADSRVEAENLERAYDVYRSRHGIPSPSEIAKLRNAYGLSLREFSRFLGFGEQTVARYENGSLPDDIHANTILQAKTAEGARLLLDANRERISPASIAKVERFIQRKGGSQVQYAISTITLYSFKDAAPMRPCRENGYRVLDLDRLSALANRLALKCTNLYKTKFQKAMNFCDTLAFERFSRSITGLSYAHAKFGPVIDGKEDVMHYLATQGIVQYEEDGYGEIVTATQDLSSDVFTEEELELIDEVAEFVNSFSSAKSISEFSHGLEAWQKTENGEKMPYDINAGELGKAIEARRNQHPYFAG